MIDTHLHILPGIDDGPVTMEESIALARTLVQEGIHTAVATPHYNDKFPRRSAAEIRERVSAAQQALNQCGVPLRLLAGHEVLIKPDLLRDIRTGHLATLNGSRYLLLELWNSGWVVATEQVIFELIANGITPIIAHIERYAIFQQEPHTLDTLLHQGVLTQITASSLVGLQGKMNKRAAEHYLKQGWVHLIVSDAHGQHKRPPVVAQGLQRALQLVGPTRVHQLTESNPAAILGLTQHTLESVITQADDNNPPRTLSRYEFPI